MSSPRAVQFTSAVVPMVATATVSTWLALVGPLLKDAMIAVTLSIEVPIDNKTRTWIPETLPSDWQDLQARQAAFHTLRTFLALAAVAAAVDASFTVPAGGHPR